MSVLAYDGMSPFELGIVTEVFGLHRPELDIDWYRLLICADGPVRVVGGAMMHAENDLAALAAADTVIIPGVADVRAPVPAPVVAALRSAHTRGARLVSICSGAFALAAAGLLEGRRAATHWRYAPLLAERHPGVEVDADVLYVDDGDILTSAGSAAGIDLCVHLVRTDHGATVANAVARRLVVAPHREGGQAQFIEAPVQAVSADAVADSMTWALANLAEPITVESLARRSHLSPRTYLRRFKQTTGTSPIRWLITQRVQASLALLETGTHPIPAIAAAVGFESPVTYRHHFTRAMRTSPSAYRRAFQERR
ncbi:transcriptional regulator, AraC family with amidase-like domain [Actinokineospora diospyrosa]|uniref:Transcriptional regulator, AraC family with amidase-like domain n=1 Tax=Actinokineospora diospyrosa TaxID=103728 RepID=A0ABT1IA83_9PSEU|nr:helix-turn-helix domain-containing protein [Actinokineospora diospyrosa]MCP2269537.1 transcriptional regulator, AraC family with amidase-like domain [Actinokineospora diospyrosa]